MLRHLSHPSFLPFCILAGVGLMFVVLAFALPPNHAFALVAGTAVAAGLVVARLHREATAREPVERRARAKA